MVLPQLTILVSCGDEILLGFDVIDNGNVELKEMDKAKVGVRTVSLSNTSSFFYFLQMPRYTFIFHLEV
ncbi:MAG TPA: hypothetical protein VN703_04500 [Candidatus Sulfopaludibacter sp.]|jgi:hypothetical protein|nr:hypothetical protein [Candidatus Sulfopaludibacter sp.]